MLLSLAATPGPLPAAVATRLGEGRDPSSLLRAHSPEPGAGRLTRRPARLLVPMTQAGRCPSHRPTHRAPGLRRRAGPARAAASVAVVAVVAPRRCAGSPPGPSAPGSPGPAGASSAAARSASTRPPTPVPWTLAARPSSCSAAAWIVLSPRQRRPVRQRAGLAARCSANTRPAASPRGQLPPAQPSDRRPLGRRRGRRGRRGLEQPLHGPGRRQPRRRRGPCPPGAPWDPGTAGCNQLIRDGATGAA